MIQDDPINQKSKTTTNNNNEYFPLNNDSEEDIVAFKGIELAKEEGKDVGEDGVNSTNTEASAKSVYYKFAMLIGLCKSGN